tara:strand:- start:1504 stop:1635 length:132 start_codon:yes stop_codon:yes gene_type:complete
MGANTVGFLQKNHSIYSLGLHSSYKIKLDKLTTLYLGVEAEVT